MENRDLADYIIDLLTGFDEMGFQPTTTVPDPEAYAIEWRNKLTNALAGYRKQEWISVEEHLPENNGNIITYQGNSREIGVYYYCGNGEVVDNRGDFASLQYYGITHWMPLPEPPKGFVDGKAD